VRLIQAKHYENGYHPSSTELDEEIGKLGASTRDMDCAAQYPATQLLLQALCCRDGQAGAERLLVTSHGSAMAPVPATDALGHAGAISVGCEQLEEVWQQLLVTAKPSTESFRLKRGVGMAVTDASSLVSGLQALDMKRF
jgi:hypothetical protein